MIKVNLHTHLNKVSALLQAISPEPRLRILLAIGTGEACVCHLEAILGYRQAYISQQLMALREAGLLIPRRDGKYIFYRLGNTEILVVIRLAGKLAGLDTPDLTTEINTHQDICGCPACSIPLVSL